jgi:hypothetical protein
VVANSAAPGPRILLDSTRPTGAAIGFVVREVCQ